MKVKIEHDDLKLGSGGTQEISTNSSGIEVKREYLDAQHRSILSIMRDSEGIVVEVDSDSAKRTIVIY